MTADKDLLVRDDDLRHALRVLEQAREHLEKGNTAMLAYHLGRLNENISDLYWKSPEAPAPGSALEKDADRSAEEPLLGKAIAEGERMLIFKGTFEWVLARIRRGTPVERFRRRGWADGLHLTTMTEMGVLRVAGYCDGSSDEVNKWDMRQLDWEEVTE